VAKQDLKRIIADIQKQQAELVKQSESIMEQMKQLEEQQKQLESAQASEEQREQAKQRHETVVQSLAMGTAGVAFLTASVNAANAAVDEQTVLREQNPPALYEQAQPAPESGTPSFSVRMERVDRVEPLIDLSIGVDKEDILHIYEVPTPYVIPIYPHEYRSKQDMARWKQDMVRPKQDMLKQDIAELLEKHPDSKLKRNLLMWLKEME